MSVEFLRIINLSKQFKTIFFQEAEEWFKFIEAQKVVAHENVEKEAEEAAQKKATEKAADDAAKILTEKKVEGTSRGYNENIFSLLLRTLEDIQKE